MTVRVRSKVVSMGVWLVALGLWAGAAAADVVPPGDWGTMQTVGYNQVLTYEFSVPGTSPLTITCQFQPSAYAPGSYQAGFISPGWFRVTQDGGGGAYEGNVIFDMAKPYSEPFDQSYTMILIGDEGRGSEVADYVPGGLYTATMVWDRGAATIDISVQGPNGLFSRTVNSSGLTVTGLTFQGPNDPSVGTSAFGNVSVTVPEPATMGLVGLGLAARRRRRAGR